MNCISATGRMPIIAAPTAAPTIAVSAIGVSMTRLLAELADEAVGDLEGATVDADVLAQEEDPLVAGHLLPEPFADRVDVGGLALDGRTAGIASKVRNAAHGRLRTIEGDGGGAAGAAGRA